MIQFMLSKTILDEQIIFRQNRDELPATLHSAGGSIGEQERKQEKPFLP